MSAGVAAGFRWFGYLLMVAFVPIVVLFWGFLGYVIFFDLLKNVGLATQVLGIGLLVAVPVGIWMLMRRDPGAGFRRISTPLRPHRFLCQLRTLPGVIGGWFKADVEIVVPYPPAKPIKTTLTFILERSSVWHAWSASYRLPAQFEPLGDAAFRTSIPVVFFVPTDVLKHGSVEKSVLSVEMEAQDQSVYRGSFEVPIFETTTAPAQEQQPEPAPTPEIVVRQILDSM